MKIDLIQSGNWDAANLALGQEIDIFSGRNLKKNLRIFKGLNHGVYEISVGSNLLLSHKRAVGLVNGNTPFFKDIKQTLFKEGFSVQSINLSELCDQKIEAKAWVESLKKDTNYVLFSSDHPVTGELFSLWQKLDQELNEKKIFSFRISHSDWLRDLKDSGFEIRPYSVHLMSVAPDFAFALCGEKFKAVPLMAGNMFWDPATLVADLQKTFANFEEDKSLVQNFEKNLLPANWQPFELKNPTERLYDRALICNSGVNAEAVMSELLKNISKDQISISQSAPGFLNSVETSSLCRWGGINLYDHWWESKPSDEILRGLLVISAQLIKDTKIKSELEKATHAVKL
jgi:hypothetical protein